MFLFFDFSVNSLPEFSKQYVLSERPNSLSAVTDSLSRMHEMRLTSGQSVEEETTYHSTRTASNLITNSDDSYYEANVSPRSSLVSAFNEVNGVRPKILNINEVSPTVDSVPTATNCTQIANPEPPIDTITTTTASSSYALDENNNLKLKLAKVPFGRMVNVSIAYITSPSSFWLHLNPNEVTSYIHEIQKRQHEFSQTANCRLSSADIQLGMYCAAIYPSDDYWYRAQVIAIVYEDPIECDSVKTVRVLYIDWGNCEDLPLTQIMKLDLSLCKRRQAIHCYIQGVLENYKWPEKLVNEFKDLMAGKQLNATFVKSHKINERLDSVIYPTDLMMISEDGKSENMINFLPVSETLRDSDEELEQNNRNATNGQYNGLSNNSLGANDESVCPKQNVIELKSRSNQNCASTSAQCNGQLNVSKLPKSMPHLNIDLGPFKNTSAYNSRQC